MRAADPPTHPRPPHPPRGGCRCLDDAGNGAFPPSLLQDGPAEVIRESTRYCLEHASPGGGYIFGTSNTIFPGMPLENYEYMLEVYREYCDTVSREPT